MKCLLFRFVKKKNQILKQKPQCDSWMKYLIQWQLFICEITENKLDNESLKPFLIWLILMMQTGLCMTLQFFFKGASLRVSIENRMNDCRGDSANLIAGLLLS